ncbi:Transposon Ty3-I Gag-Pol polyprotein [Senna tora]|uniref:Transposon Ty3-I Gag-Pol polyprotein n=1 Tax=Senna tora TaxID=362788 RepID=A0A834XEH7_9FABA|nr:Transposon Ty3-I Gag-Pol polyprotein [Senna tora]
MILLPMAEGTHYAKLDEALRVLQDDASEFKRVSLVAQEVYEQRLSQMESTMKNVEALLQRLEVSQSSSHSSESLGSTGLTTSESFHAQYEDRNSYIVSVAYSWYKWMHQNNLLKSWQGFVNELLLRFGTSLFDDPTAALKDIKQQHGSVPVIKHGLRNCLLWIGWIIWIRIVIMMSYLSPIRMGLSVRKPLAMRRLWVCLSDKYSRALNLVVPSHIGVGGNLDSRVGNRQCNPEMWRLPRWLLCILAFGVEARDSAGSSPKHIVVYPRMCFLDLLGWFLEFFDVVARPPYV